MTKDIKTDVFYGLVASGAMNEISKSADIFNKTQQAYYNIQKAISGISLSREMLKEFKDKPTNSIPGELIVVAKNTIRQGSQKIKRVTKMAKDAREEIEKELGKYGATFTLVS
ncbi:unnamed protein product [marine sediment metagenome]|uniref:Uncharacterized protein n=1 Tax=marine sediment metagenome TaxID=412755 RepID=X1T8A6_9ZZZZ